MITLLNIFLQNEISADFPISVQEIGHQINFAFEILT